MPGGSVPPVTAHEYGANPPPAESEAAYGTPMVPTARLVVVTFGRSREGGDGAAEVRSGPDGFAVDRTGARHPEEGGDAGRGSLARPSGAAVGRGEDVGAADRGAGRRTDAADGFQGGRSGGSAQVAPVGAAVCRADDVGSGGQAGRVARTRDAGEDGGCSWEGSAGPRWSHRSPSRGSTALGPPDETPDAVQCRASGQEMPVKLVTSPGNGSVVHVAPPFAVAMMLGAEAAEVAHGLTDRVLGARDAGQDADSGGNGSEVQVAAASTSR